MLTWSRREGNPRHMLAPCSDRAGCTVAARMPCTWTKAPRSNITLSFSPHGIGCNPCQGPHRPIPWYHDATGFVGVCMGKYSTMLMSRASYRRYRSHRDLSTPRPATRTDKCPRLRHAIPYAFLHSTAVGVFQIESVLFLVTHRLERFEAS